jgi:alpha-glucosidase
MTHWWEHAVVYQVYVRSFADANGDGIGDLEGLRRRLDYIASLGVDAIWLNPIYPSPQRDHGYDVADYFAIHPAYGDLRGFDRLLADARQRGLRVLMDIVPNHCSDEHPWFQAAIAAPPGSDARDRFYFRDGNGVDTPPNNWAAAFGGSAWTRVDGGDGQWYLGTFTPYQPDFDHDHPAVQELFAEVLRFWAERGVEGFRVDAVHPVGKAPGLPDAPPLAPGEYNPYTYYRPEGHAVWRRWRQVVDSFSAAHPGRDVMMIAEAYAPRHPELIAEYTRPDEFHQCFAFDLLLSPWHSASMRRAIGEAFEHVLPQGNWPTFALNNHDAERIVTRLGADGVTRPEAWTGGNLHSFGRPVDVEVGTRRARAAAGLLLGLPGATYLYQGEELGLPEFLDLPDELRQDPVFTGTSGRHKGRDGCRIPLPWTASADGAHGFSPPRGAPPWLPQPADWGRYAYDRQEGDDASMLALYRRLLAIRRQHLDGHRVELLAAAAPDDPIVALRRGGIVVACNTGLDPVDVAAQVEGLTPVLTTDPDGVLDGTVVAGDCTVWFGLPPPAGR